MQGAGSLRHVHEWLGITEQQFWLFCVGGVVVLVLASILRDKVYQARKRRLSAARLTQPQTPDQKLVDVAKRSIWFAENVIGQEHGFAYSVGPHPEPFEDYISLSKLAGSVAFEQYWRDSLALQSEPDTWNWDELGADLYNELSEGWSRRCDAHEARFTELGGATAYRKAVWSVVSGEA